MFISHKLKEVRELCDSATILRGGEVVGSCDPRTTSAEAIAELMLGSRDIKTVAADRDTGPVRLSINKLQHTQDEQSLTIDQLQLHSGEIFGVAGVAGNGQELLFHTLSGETTLPRNNSAININNTAVGASGPNARRQLGAMFVPEERLGHAAVPHMNLVDNTLLSNIANGDMVQHGLVDRSLLTRTTESIAEQFNVRHGGLRRSARNLSGGNLQKFVVGREIIKQPSLLVVNQPTWGVDALSATRIRQALLQLAADDSAILIISQDLDELLEISDRLAVLHNGTLSAARPVGEWTIESLGLAMTGSEATV